MTYFVVEATINFEKASAEEISLNRTGRSLHFINNEFEFDEYSENFFHCNQLSAFSQSTAITILQETGL